MFSYSCGLLRFIFFVVVAVVKHPEEKSKFRNKPHQKPMGSWTSRVKR